MAKMLILMKKSITINKNMILREVKRNFRALFIILKKSKKFQLDKKKNVFFIILPIKIINDKFWLIFNYSKVV